MKLFLFDIDGTLLLTHGVGRQAVETALARVLGHAVDTEPVSFSGKTDPQIFGEILAMLGVPEGRRPALLLSIADAYRDEMERALPHADVRLLPGARHAVETLAARPDALLGLVTGNLEPLAYQKLARVGLAQYFPFGAFGSDSAHRPDLPALAVQRAAQHGGHTFSGHDVVILGDTEHDIACGRGIGAFAVGVCTGRFGRDELAPHGPDLLLDSLEDADALLGAIYKNGSRSNTTSGN